MGFPFDDTSKFYTYVQSKENARTFLHHCYQSLPNVNSKAKSLQNCSAFTYYLDHGRQFFCESKKVPLIMRPLLLFYGAVHLLKAAILTRRPNYPEQTSILAHGVSTRKRKKRNYTFRHDEVKIQHNGILPYMAKYLYGLDRLPFEKVKMEELITTIPEMNGILQFDNAVECTSIGEIGKKTIQLPKWLLDTYHLTEEGMVRRIKPLLPTIMKKASTSTTIHITLKTPIKYSHGPFFFHLDEDKVYLPRDREHSLAIPETIIHYLLLYNLSMISRYETFWWGELITARSEVDYTWIKQFLHITQVKFPLLIGNELLTHIT